MKITDIQRQVRAAGRYSVFVDGNFVFGLSETGLLESGIKLGQIIDQVELKKLKKLSDTDKLYNQTLGLIARRPRSRKEINDYLARKTDDQQEITQLLNKLSNLQLIDDEDFAQRWVENRRLLKATSQRKLTLELKQKGISDETIKQVLSEDETNEQDVLRRLIIKKRTQSRYKDDQKLIAYLARQGFGYEDIKTVMQNIKN